ncbi:succinate dehydrogenase assembly factor 2 [Motiliproteus sp. SC1-56]|uniref:FAD assembly factor SdhE n=1 Tax=Motiliproteus sp. SC1-56 TaxID=2799565 RepID=UPI001A8D2587|nr:succinate dehydrogenase assembly factor 2 [Motiliproteus sp. SC1-56]
MYTETDINRLSWHCRRGMLELDVLLIPFLKERFRDLDLQDQTRFEKLIACEDQDIFSWFMRHKVPEDADLKRIVDLILDGVPD